MAVLDNTTTSTQFSVTARKVDFVTRFGQDWTALREILGIMRPIRKAPGTTLRSYKTTVDTALASGDVAEGDVIPFTKFKVEEVSYSDVTIEKYAKAVTLEAVSKYGAEVAIEKTDEQFRVELTNKILSDFYTFLKTGTLTGSENTWQLALAKAKGAVLNKFGTMNKSVTEIIGFANVMDAYTYLGSADITIQTMNGVQYVKDFLGYGTLFLLDENKIPSGTVIAVPSENIDLYYIDPSDSDFKRLGLDYTVDGETNLIGYGVEGNYSRAMGESYAVMGMKLWAEYLDGIAVYTVAAGE